MSDLCSAASAAWMQDWQQPDSPMSSSANPTNGDEVCSPTTGPECPATTTFALSENQRGELNLTPYSRQLTTGGGKPGQGYPAVMVPTISFDSTWSGRYPISGDDISPTIKVGSSVGAPSPPAVMVPTAVAEFNGTTSDIHHTLRAGTKQATGVLTTDLAVRRLTPTECERLMGWPDGWTAHRADGTPIADGPRDRMCGNGVVATVAQWIAHRMLTVPAVKNTEPDKDTP
jgi:site-specific DNA-cytosine methylase